MDKHYSIRVLGKVQGVFFRALSKEKADELGITGFVRNEPAGDVYIEAEGEEDSIQQLIIWCRTGPPRAVVEAVRANEGTVVGYKEFSVHR